MGTLLAVIEATLLGKDERLVAKCNVPGILAVFERWDIYDVDTLSASLASSFADLQRDLTPVAAMSFLPLLKATISRVCMPSAPPPDTPSSAPPTTPFTEVPPCFSPPLHPPPPTTVPIVVTVKMNGKVLSERTTLPVPPAATWEAVARMRLESVLNAADVQSYMSTPLAVSLFPTADHSPSDRVNAAVSDTVAGGFALGYPHDAFSVCNRRLPRHSGHPAAGRSEDDGARTPAARERQAQGVQGGRRRAARMQLLHRGLPQLGSVPGRGQRGERVPCQVRLVPVGVPGLLQEGCRRRPAGGTQAHGPARCRRQEAAQEAHQEVRIGVAWAVC